MIMEKWKSIDTYGTKYKVSTHGRIESNRSCTPRILKDSSNGKGYRYITISINSLRKNHYIHRVVAKAWINNPLNLPEVNHIDGNKSNNHINNLEWVTLLQNRKHASENKLMKSGSNHFSAIQLFDTSTGVFYDIIKDAAKAKNINYGTLKDAINKKGCYKNLIKA